MRQQRSGERLGLRTRVGRIGMARLGREGVALEPVEQLGAVRGDHVELHAVHVGVDQARRQQAAAVVLARPVGAWRLRTRQHTGDAAVVDQQPVVGAVAHTSEAGCTQARIAGEIEQVRAQRPA